MQVSKGQGVGKDSALLQSIQAFFGVGNINVQKSNGKIAYSVTSFKDLAVIINHFDKYPLITKKRTDY